MDDIHRSNADVNLMASISANVNATRELLRADIEVVHSKVHAENQLLRAFNDSGLTPDQHFRLHRLYFDVCKTMEAEKEAALRRCNELRDQELEALTAHFATELARYMEQPIQEQEPLDAEHIPLQEQLPPSSVRMEQDSDRLMNLSESPIETAIREVEAKNSGYNVAQLTKSEGSTRVGSSKVANGSESLTDSEIRTGASDGKYASQILAHSPGVTKSELWLAKFEAELQRTNTALDTADSADSKSQRRNLNKCGAPRQPRRTRAQMLAAAEAKVAQYSGRASTSTMKLERSGEM